MIPSTSAGAPEADAAPEVPPRRRRSRWAWLRRLWALSTGRFGLIVVGVVVATAVVAQVWTP